ncbi:MAG: winged helix-turn-helix domain-containing protein [Candidatus Bathyarchaeia archaeon]
MAIESMAMPDYQSALSSKNSIKIIEAIAKARGVASFSEIQSLSGVKDSVLTHHLNRLQRFHVIEKEVKGTYRLTYKTPLCFIYPPKTRIPIAYFGLLGKKDSRKEPEPQFAIKILEGEGLRPDLAYVTTSPEALNDWKDIKLPYQWILCYEDEIANVDAVKRKVLPQLESLLRNYIVIMDCTSATKPATIAYYEIAQTYLIPLIYIYEETKELKWLISRETIKEKLRV